MREIIGAPRTCGDDPCLPSQSDVLQLVLPAHAGMIPGYDETFQTCSSAPRTCGDDPYGCNEVVRIDVCSPHMRG